MSLDTPYQAFHRIINNYNAQQEDESKKLPMIPLHGLRHTAATLLIGQHVNIRTVSDRLGHANVSTTLNFYSHAIKELDRNASDELEKLLLPKSEQFQKSILSTGCRPDLKKTIFWSITAGKYKC